MSSFLKISTLLAVLVIASANPFEFFPKDKVAADSKFDLVRNRREGFGGKRNYYDQEDGTDEPRVTQFYNNHKSSQGFNFGPGTEDESFSGFEYLNRGNGDDNNESRLFGKLRGNSRFNQEADSFAPTFGGLDYKYRNSANSKKGFTFGGVPSGVDMSRYGERFDEGSRGGGSNSQRRFGPRQNLHQAKEGKRKYGNKHTGFGFGDSKKTGFPYQKKPYL